MEDGYGLLSRRQGSSVWSSVRNEEFQEEDVLEVFKERKDSDHSRIMNSLKEHSLISKPFPSAARMIPQSNKNPNSQQPKTIQNSAPVSIPDWSKIYGTASYASKNAAYSSLDSDLSDVDGNNISDHGLARTSRESEEDDDYNHSKEEDDEEGKIVIPPHEWIARKLARNQISSFSVCEGAGRTLKGRDLRRVRNAVLIRTGFLESKSD